MTIGRETRSPRRATFKWTVERYERLADLGIFRDRRVELIEGEILEMSPQNVPHAVALSLLVDTLRVVFAGDYWVRSQLPLALLPESEPEPDVAVVVGSPRSHSTKGHPTSALLVVEVADSSLGFDRGAKAALYAEAGVEDYWIVNLVDRVLEIRRRPDPDRARPGAFRYAETITVVEGGSASPLASPGSSIRLSEILP